MCAYTPFLGGGREESDAVIKVMTSLTIWMSWQGHRGLRKCQCAGDEGW